MFLLPPFLKEFLEKRQREKELLTSANAEERYAGIWGALSEREREITAMICLGYRNYEIADALGISFDAVQSLSKRIYSRFGLTRRDLRRALRDWDFEEWLESRRAGG